MNMGTRKAVQAVEPDFQTLANQAGERCVESCREELDALKAAHEAEDSTAIDEAGSAIHESPLSVQVRSGWYAPGQADAAAQPAEYELLLSWGGPASRIIGDLDEQGEPESAHFEFQDWGTPWTRARLSGEDEDTLLEWARQFYFGS